MQLKEAEEEMADLVAPLTKALSRIMKQGSSERLNLQHRNVFEQLRTMPSQVADKDIAGSLEELQSHLATLGLKDRKKEKTLDHIDLLIKKKSLQKTRVRQAELEKDHPEKRRRFSPRAAASHCISKNSSARPGKTCAALRRRCKRSEKSFHCGKRGRAAPDGIEREARQAGRSAGGD